MEKSQTNILKEELRLKIREKVEIINIKYFCEKIGVNYANTRCFISGRDSAMTLENAQKLWNYIEYVDKYDFTK